MNLSGRPQRLVLDAATRVVATIAAVSLGNRLTGRVRNSASNVGRPARVNAIDYGADAQPGESGSAPSDPGARDGGKP